MLPFVLYARKSTESDDRQALSIDAQVAELSDYALKHGLAIRQVYTESKSAKRSGRPIFAEMLKQLRREKGLGVLCWKLDRLTRNLADGALISEAMEDGVISEIRTMTQVYRNNSTDKFMTHLDFIMAKKYIDDLSENVRRGQRAKVQLGWRPGGVPLGYLNDPVNPKGQKTISLDPERAPLVRRMWDLMLSGRYSVMEILRTANDKWGLRTRTSRHTAGGPLSRAAIYRMFTDPFYCGLFLYSGELHQGRHPALVSAEEFDIVQGLLGRKGKPRPKTHTFDFRGLLTCGQCGASVTAEEKFKWIKSLLLRRRYVYYHCSHRKDPACSQRSLTEGELRRQIDAYLARLTIPKPYLDWAFKYLDQVTDREAEKNDQRTELIHKEASKIDSKLQNLLALRIAPENAQAELLTDSEFLKQKNRLLQEKYRLESQVGKSSSGGQSMSEATREVFRFAAHARGWFRNGDVEQQRTILTSVGSNRTLKDGKLLILAQKPLALIEEHLSGQTASGGRFEPEDLGLRRPQSAASKRRSLGIRGRRDDVRTLVVKVIRVIRRLRRQNRLSELMPLPSETRGTKQRREFRP